MDAKAQRNRSRRRRPAVMSDVGRLAGVSHQTVSRVINGSPHVREETRQRVIAAMRELDYHPNSMARALVTGRSSTLGVVSFDTTLYGPASTLFGIERAAHDAGYFIIVASLKALDRESIDDAVERLRLHGVDGILVIAPMRESAEALLHVHAGGGIPLVAVEAGPDASVPVVAVDQDAGAAMATETVLRVNALPYENEEQDRANALDEPRVYFLIPCSFRKVPDRQLIAPRSILSLYPLRC